MTDRNDTLASLYPWQHGRVSDAASLKTGVLQSIRAKADDSVAVKQRFFSEQGEKLLTAAEALAASFAGGGRLFTMGNGGSSCDAQHVAVEFNHPVTTGRPALPAQCLVTDIAMLSAVANDVGVEQIFVRQLIAQARAGDTLIGLSTSGNSSNLMAAFAQAQAMGLTTIGLAGGDGGQMAESSSVQHCLTVPTDSIHRVQETHVAIFHILWDVVHTLLADKRGKSGEQP